MIKCPCGRPFVTGYSYVEHAFLVHGTDDQARTLPKIKHKGKFAVPYLSTGSGEGVDRKGSKEPKGKDGTGEGHCAECATNTDPLRLPVHPRCECEPDGGWEAFINKIADEKPSNWTKKQWATHIQDLREAHDVDAPDED